MFDILIKQIKKDKLFFVGFVSFLAIAIALGSELVLDLKPCMLCLYQRFIYVLLFGVASLGLLVPISRKLCLFLIPVLLFSEIGFALYHVAVEHYLIEENYMCTTGTEISSKFQQYLTFKKIMGSCSQGVFKFMNFSMAEWNIFYSGLITYLFMRKK